MEKIPSIIEKEIEKQFSTLSEKEKEEFCSYIEKPQQKWAVKRVYDSSPRELFKGEEEYEPLIRKGNKIEKAFNTAIYNAYRELQKLLQEE